MNEVVVGGYLIIPFERLSEEALLGIIEEYITREGTDYGEVELSLENKVSTLRHLIQRGEVLLVFDEKLETVNLVNKQDLEGS